MADGDRKYSLKLKLWVAFGVAVLALTTAFAVMWSQRDRGIPESLAHVYCEETVQSLVDIPGDARFKGITASQNDALDWQIEGQVNGENADGEDVDFTYHCDISGDADGLMQSITVDIDGERSMEHP
ncbi:hypothetical protein [Hoyosella altamirensis]|uniref:Uncharacterized protein n=1 Tax=Hoyosella altamirensis TaxID=616997 RepID=A0A839RGX7_9ACTN|nr:hypothetical protein [Hoyosella altamirensis]MBB3035982.1 hypothetical protein [Hoyosella altamirensis]